MSSGFGAAGGPAGFLADDGPDGVLGFVGDKGPEPFGRGVAVVLIFESAPGAAAAEPSDERLG